MRNFEEEITDSEYLTSDILSQLTSQFMELFIAELSSEDTTLTMYR